MPEPETIETIDKAEAHLIHYAFALLNKTVEALNYGPVERVEPKVWLAEAHGKPEPYKSLTELTRGQAQSCWDSLERVFHINREAVMKKYEQEKNLRETRRSAEKS